MKVIVGAPNRCIEDPDVIQKILTHLHVYWRLRRGGWSLVDAD